MFFVILNGKSSKRLLFNLSDFSFDIGIEIYKGYMVSS